MYGSKSSEWKADREKRMEQIVADLGLNEKQAKDFKAAMKEMRPAKNKSNERPTREEMQKKRQEIDAKIKSILTDEQYKKYQDMRKKDNAKKKKKQNKYYSFNLNFKRRIVKVICYDAILIFGSFINNLFNLHDYFRSTKVECRLHLNESIFQFK